MQIIDRKKFAAVVWALSKKAFLLYVAYLEAKLWIYLAWKAQIALLLTKKVSVFEEYADFLYVFFKNSVAVHSNYSNKSRVE